MPTITDAPVAKKSAYNRPYRTRQQRRLDARRKFDGSSDHRFLWRALAVVGVLLAVALGFVAKGLANREKPTPPVEAQP